MTCPCIVQNSVPVCLAVIPHRFYMKKRTVWVVECDKFETVLKCLLSGDPTIHCVSKKNGGGLGKFMQTHFWSTSFPGLFPLNLGSIGKALGTRLTFDSLRADTLNLVSTLYAIRGPAAPQVNFSAYNEGARPQTTTLTSYQTFQNLCGKFSHSKAILFFSFSLYINVEKVCKSKTTLMSLNWETAFKQEITEIIRWRHR